MRSRSLSTFSLALLLTFTGAVAAHAHPGHYHPPVEIDEFETQHSLLAGLQHPFSGWDHLMAAVLIGAAGALMVSRMGRKLTPAAFMTGLAAGGAMGAAGVFLPGASVAVAATLIVAGLAITFRKATPAALTVTAAAIFGLWQGNAHALLVPLPQMMLPYAAGFVASSALLLATGFALGKGLEHLSMRAVRLA